MRNNERRDCSKGRLERRHGPAYPSRSPERWDDAGEGGREAEFGKPGQQIRQPFSFSQRIMVKQPSFSPISGWLPQTFGKILLFRVDGRYM